MKSRMLVVGLSYMGVACLCSCIHTGGGAPEGVAPAPNKAERVVRHRIFPDAKSSEYFDIVKVDDKTLPTGKMKGIVSLRNKQDTPFKFSYKFIWFDSKGKELKKSSEKWTETDIMGNATKNISAVAPNTKGVDFQVKLMALE